MSELGADRLQQIQQELSSILERRLNELSSSIRVTERATRQIISTELEIQRHKQRQREFDLEHEELKLNLDETKTKLDSLRAQKEDLIVKQAELNAELVEEESEVARYKEAAEKSRVALQEMEEESKSLRNENAKLKIQVKTLNENIEGMKRLRDEQMLSVMNLTKDLHQVTTGNKEE